MTLPEPIVTPDSQPAAPAAAPPPGCQVRGCCCGIPFGCGSVLLLAGLAVSGILTAQSVQQSVQRGMQRTQAQQQQQSNGAEVEGLADRRQGIEP
jgi:hypothetical protein